MSTSDRDRELVQRVAEVQRDVQRYGQKTRPPTSMKTFVPILFVPDSEGGNIGQTSLRQATGVL